MITGAGVVGIAGWLAGCTGEDSPGGNDDGGGAASAVTVEMTNELAYKPDTVSVDVGQTITWTNVSSMAHSVTAYEDRIPSDAEYFASGDFDAEAAARDAFPNKGGIRAGESYHLTFATAGTYEYFCIPHEGTGMTGTVDVS